MKIIYCFLTTILVLLSSSFTDNNNDYNEYSEISCFFNENINIMKNEYEKKFSDVWEVKYVEDVKKIYSLSDEELGWLVIFDNGWLAYSFEKSLLAFETTGKPIIYNNGKKIYYSAGEFLYKINNEFYLENGNLLDFNVGKGQFDSSITHKLTTAINYDGFTFTSCCTKIPNISSNNSDIDWGDYKAVSFYQGDTTDCGVIAIMDLLYTYKLSTKHDFVKNHSYTEMRKELRLLTNWQGNIVGEGMLPFDLTRGCTDYISIDGVSLNASLETKSVPQIGFYSNLNVANTAHYCMKVGTAETPYWWFFKTYWDVVVTWYSNIYVDNNGIVKDIYNNNDMFYVIDQQYRQSLYSLYENNKIIS